MRKNGTGGICSNRTVACILAGAGLLLTPAASRAQAPPAFTISTIAGTGAAGFTGDGGAATAAQLNNPCALLVDRSGNIYIGDQINYRVRKMTNGGNISTVVGNGTAGDTGSGGAATSAEIRSACGLAVDGSGNLYLSDTGSFKIKKVTSSGTISDFAGNGTGGLAGDGQALNVAEFNRPTGLVLDAAGNLYIADSGNHAIRKITASGTLSTFAGNGRPGYIGDGGAAGSAQLNNPTALAIDAAGNIYVADTDNGVIRKITPGGGTITTIAGTGSNGYSGDGGPATSATLNHPRGLAVDAAGNIYIADTVNHRIRVVLTNGKIYTVAGTGGIGKGGDGGSATRAGLNFPTALAIDGAGNVYVADSQNNEIRMLALIPVPPGPPAVNGVISASQFGAFAAAAPGSWIEIYGSNLAGDTRNWTTADFNGNFAPTALDQTSVTIGGQAAFISAISPGQVNVQIPSNVGPGPQPLIVTTAAGVSAPFTITVKAAQPGLYAPAQLLAGGKQYTAQFNSAPQTYVMPAGAVSGVTSSPAHVGDTIVVWGVGFGPVTPAINAGQIVQQLNTLTVPVQFSIGGIPAAVSYAGLAPQAVGLYQFNIVVPNVPPGDALPLTFSQGGVAGTQTLYIAVQ